MRIEEVGGVTIVQGDALESLRLLDDQSVNCCVTSPPYWGLRDYGTATWEGGDPACAHKQGRPGSGRADGIVDDRAQRNRDGAGAMGGDCGKCGATRIDSQLGLEPTPAEYVEKMVAVFREVRRVLRDDGTLWLNLGDSYASDPKKGGSGPGGKNGYGEGYARGMRKGSGRADGIVTDASPRNRDGAPPCELPAKNLIGIPWRVAFALQADGWYLRQDIIWAKPNPMPESVRDRCTKAHEYIFMFAKSERYYFDADAIKEPSVTGDTRKPYAPGQVDARGDGHDRGGGSERVEGAGQTRNKRSVWTVTTKPFKEAHFATFPPDLIEPCILAGTSEKGYCPHCGAGWKRETKTEYKHHEKWFGDKQDARHSRGAAGVSYDEPIATRTTGWAPTCKCPTHDPIPAVVLDPFSGAGTTGLVAQRSNRRAILLELNPAYIDLTVNRLKAG